MPVAQSKGQRSDDFFRSLNQLQNKCQQSSKHSKNTDGEQKKTAGGASKRGQRCQYNYAKKAGTSSSVQNLKQGGYMKRITYLAFGLTCLLGLVPLAQAQYTGVLQVRYQSTAYPESFDQFVANNQSLFDNRFFSCLNSLEGVWRPLANQEAATCEIHLNPQWKQKCLSEAKFLSLYTWSKSVRVVLAGTSRWVDTPAGKAAITGKSFTEAMMPGIFVLGIEQSIPAQSPDLVCR